MRRRRRRRTASDSRAADWIRAIGRAIVISRTKNWNEADGGGDKDD
jgi:hypothetical protein